MTIDIEFANKIASGIQDNIAAEVPTKGIFVRSGYGDGSGRIVYDASKRMIYYFEGELGGFQRSQGKVYLPTGKGLVLRDGKDQENHRMEIRERQIGSTTRWEVYEVFFEGTDGRDPAQQEIDKASQPTISQLDSWRPQPTGALGYVVKGTLYYTKPSTGERRVKHDPTGSVSTQVSALTSGQHQPAILYFDTEAEQMAIATGTAVTASATLPSSSSRGEFYAETFTYISVPSYGMPVANVYLYYGQAELAEADYYRKYDPRQLFTPERDAWATLTTTNNTTTTIVSIPIAELRAVTIVGEVVATRDDYSASLTANFRYGVRRASGGNVTAIASPTISQDEDSSGSPALSLDVDTGTQTARIRATGITAENWLWRVRYSIIRV